MKSLSASFTILLIAITIVANADDSKYVEVMKKNITALYQAKTIPDFQNAINSLDRIAAAEKDKWEPLYYTAFGYVMMATREEDKTMKDSYLDLALTATEKAKAILPNDSEIVALEGFVHMIRVSVDPSSRGPQYAGLAMQTLGKAAALNPENPRALALMAQMQYGTAQFFKAPTTEACANVAKSLEKFESFKSDNPLAPVWGRGMAEGMKEQCK